MKKTKIIFLLSAMVILCFLLTACDSKTPATPSATPGQSSTPKLPENPASDFQYELYSDGNKVRITKYIGTSETVVIPSEIDNLPVSMIANTPADIQEVEGAFENSNVVSVVVPDSVVSFGAKAFENCKQLKNITISSESNLQAICYGAFRNCKSLESVDFSSSKIIAIEWSAFAGCSALKEIKLPDSVTKIDKGVFYECTSLVEIDLPDELTEIGQLAFVGCKALKKVIVPTKLDLFVIGNPIFDETDSLEQIVFKEGREEITGYSYFPITTNAEVIIPKSVKVFSPLILIPKGENGRVSVKFSGDCPQVKDEEMFLPLSEKLTIYYDPATKGWEEFKQNTELNVEPIKG